MSDILIRGMEMPKNCIDCAFGWNGWCHRINRRAFVEVDIRRHDCPLIEFPPHGALMDRDEFFAACPELVDGYKTITDDLVVIPAEEGE